MKPNEVRDKSSAELQKMVADLEEELFRLRLRKCAGQLKQTANLKKARRDIARAKTVIAERDRKAAKEAR